jgi:hypothetical protein
MALTVQGVIETWLHSVLSGNSAVNTATSGNIFADEVPQELGEAGFPCVLYGFIAGQDETRYGGATRVYSNVIYKVEVLHTGTPADADAIYTLVDALIHAKAGTVTGGKVISCVRTQPRSFTETLPGGSKIRHAGGLYLLQVQTD